MLRTIAWYINFAVSLVFTIPGIYKTKFLERKGRVNEKIEYVHRKTSKWAMSQVKMSGARVKIFGQENVPRDGAVLFVSNHQGNFDIALFMSYIDKPKGYISKIEMKRVPIVNKWMEYLNCVFMERGNIRKSVEAIKRGIEILKDGYSLVVFPEGTRSKGRKMGEFKAGSFKLATRSSVPIIPVTINGSYKLMEKNNNRIKPDDVEVYIHPMIETSSLSKEEIDMLPIRVKEIIKSKLHYE